MYYRSVTCGRVSLVVRRYLMVVSADIPKLVLDPNSDQQLLDQAKTRVKFASSGTITDLSQNSPVTALLEGQVFATAELLYYLNMLPEALALEVFRLFQVERSSGTTAKGDLTFQLTAPISNAFTLPEGYVVGQGELRYRLLAPLTIPAGGITAVVPCEAVASGSAYNRPAYGLSIRPNLNFLQAVYNTGPIAGGSDVEELSRYLSRATRAIRERDTLVSQSDYERAARDVLPTGYVARAIPFLSSDRSNTAPGQVHLFLLSDLAEPVPLALASSVQADLTERLPAGLKLWVSPALTKAVDVSLVLLATDLSATKADEIAQTVRDYLSPADVGIGKDAVLDDLRFRVRNVASVTRVVSGTLDRKAQDIAMPNAYTQAIYGSITIDLLDGEGFVKTYRYGEIGDPV